MKIKIIIISVLYLLSATFTFSNDFFKLNVGDTIVPFDKGNYKLRVYFFVKPETCECIKLLPVIFEETKSSQIENICFLSGANDSLTQYFKNKYKINFEIIPDKINSYHEFFKVKTINVLLVSDADGKVLYVSDIDYESISKIKENLRLENEKKSDVKNSHFELFKSINVDFEDSHFYINMSYLNIFKTPNKSGQYIFINDDCVYKLNDLGKITDSLFLNFPDESKFNYFLPAFKCKSDSMLFLNAFSYTNSFYKINRKLIFIDINDFKIQESRLIKDVRDSIILKSNIIIPIFENKSFLCVNDLFFYNVNYKTEPLRIVDISDFEKSKKSFGYLDSIFTKQEYKRDFRIFYSSNGSNNFIINQYSPMLQVYDSIFNNLNLVMLNFKNFNKHDLNNSNANSSFDEANKYSFIKGNFYNKDKQKILIVYENRVIPEGIMDVFSPKSKLNFYGHIIDDDFKPLFNYDIAFPERNIPFHFEEDYIYCYEIRDNKLKINIFKIKNLNAISGR